MTLLLLFLALPAAAQTTWTVSGDTAAILGQEARLVYRPQTSPGARLQADALASATTDFAVVKAQAEPNGAWTWTILPLGVGKLSFRSRWILDGKPIEAPPANIAVREPSLPPDTELADIKPPLAARRRLWPWLLAALLGAAAYEAWRRWQSRMTAAPAGTTPATPLSPEEAAAQALAELRASGAWERGEHAAYYLRLTEILRLYLEARYGEPATAMTSAEVARLVKSRQPDLRASAAVRELLARADLVKFARIRPEPADGPRDADFISQLVKATTPSGLPETAEAAQ